MVRVFSGVVLLVVFLGAIWFLPPMALLGVAEMVLALAFVEFARLADRIVGAPVPRLAAGVAAGAACGAVAWPGGPPDVVLMVAGLAVGALAVGAGRVGPSVVVPAFAAIFAPVYLGLPLGALVATHGLVGREAVLLLLLTVAASDTAQLYAGRLFGRHPLAPVVSPKKTVEGAVGGFAGGIAVMIVFGQWWLPRLSPGWLAGLAVVVVSCGMLGDLFESLLKRSAGVKDSSALIPGHGGVLDRIDGLLFAMPAYYIFLRYGMR